MQTLIRRLCALLLVVGIALAGCGAPGSELSGDYREDTLYAIEQLRETIALPNDDPAKPTAREEARALVVDYLSRYRRDAQVSGLRSFTTMQTALNAIAGYYTTSSTRPLPSRLKERVEDEFAQVESSLARGV